VKERVWYIKVKWHITKREVKKGQGRGSAVTKVAAGSQGRRRAEIRYEVFKIQRRTGWVSQTGAGGGLGKVTEQNGTCASAAHAEQRSRGSRW